MRVVHISTAISGGAGAATVRLHKSLLAKGVESDVLALNPSLTTRVPRVSVGSTAARRLIERVKRRVHHSFGLALDATSAYRDELKKAGGRYGVFTFPTTPYRLHNHRLVRDADVVHLHWIANFLDYPTFFEKLAPEKRIVWTLHDSNPLIGGFHSPQDAERNALTLGDLEGRLAKLKHKAVQNRPIHVVCLSQWILKAASSAGVLRGGSFRLIQNGLDTATFTYADPQVMRRELGLQINHKIVLFVSTGLESPCKGFDLLLDAIADLGGTASGICFLAVGPNRGGANQEGIRYIGHVASEELMAKYYQAADIVVLPSREDNLPNVMLESLCCGCPVVAFAVGGMLDVIDDSNGVLVGPVTAAALADGVRRGLRRSFHREEIGATARRRFNDRRMANEYLDLYKEVVASV